MFTFFLPSFVGRAREKWKDFFCRLLTLDDVDVVVVGWFRLFSFDFFTFFSSSFFLLHHLTCVFIRTLFCSSSAAIHDANEHKNARDLNGKQLYSRFNGLLWCFIMLTSTISLNVSFCTFLWRLFEVQNYVWYTKTRKFPTLSNHLRSLETFQNKNYLHQAWLDQVNQFQLYRVIWYSKILQMSNWREWKMTDEDQKDAKIIENYQKMIRKNFKFFPPWKKTFLNSDDHPSLDVDGFRCWTEEAEI